MFDRKAKPAFYLPARYRSVGRLRGELRRLLSAELPEIDTLARQVLGMGTS